MSGIDEACSDVVANVEGALACGVVDLDSGVLLGSEDPGTDPRLTLEVLGAAVELFRGREALDVARDLRSGAADEGFQEIQIGSERGFFLMRALAGGHTAVVLVTARSTNVGLGWAQLRKIAPALPGS